MAVLDPLLDPQHLYMFVRYNYIMARVSVLNDAAGISQWQFHRRGFEGWFEGGI